jgi:predicted amidohydrolase
VELCIATCQFPVSDDIRNNQRYILRQMKLAKEKSAEVVHFPECALGGYAGEDFKSFKGYDWEYLRHATQTVIDLSRQLKLWTILGSNHRLSGSHKPHNSIYIINPRRGIVNRYDKLFCMGTKSTLDLKHYSPGSRFVVINIKNIRCGFLICHDWRFPELYREYKRQGVKLIFQSWYDGNLSNRQMKRDGTVLSNVLPATIQGHAVCNYLWISSSNTSKPISRFGAMMVRPDGAIVRRLPRNRPGVLISTVDTTQKFVDPAKLLRKNALQGKLHSGTLVQDPRSSNLTCY